MGGQGVAQKKAAYPLPLFPVAGAEVAPEGLLVAACRLRVLPVRLLGISQREVCRAASAFGFPPVQGGVCSPIG